MSFLFIRWFLTTVAIHEQCYVLSTNIFKEALNEKFHWIMILPVLFLTSCEYAKSPFATYPCIIMLVKRSAGENSCFQQIYIRLAWNWLKFHKVFTKSTRALIFLPLKNILQMFLQRNFQILSEFIVLLIAFAIFILRNHSTQVNSIGIISMYWSNIFIVWLEGKFDFFCAISSIKVYCTQDNHIFSTSNLKWSPLWGLGHTGSGRSDTKVFNSMASHCFPFVGPIIYTVIIVFHHGGESGRTHYCTCYV